MNVQMFVISQGEACDQDCNQMREQEKIINGDSGDIIDPTVVADKCSILPPFHRCSHHIHNHCHYNVVLAQTGGSSLNASVLSSTENARLRGQVNDTSSRLDFNQEQSYEN